MSTVCPECGDPKRTKAKMCWCCSYQARGAQARSTARPGKPTTCRKCGMVEGASGFYGGGVLQCSTCGVGLGHRQVFEARS